MRALLSAARRCRQQSESPADLCALRDQCRGAGRGAPIRMITPAQRGRAGKWLLLSACIVLADQISKSYIAQRFGEFEHISVLPVLDITRMHNVGAAFSFFASASGWQRGGFICLAAGVSIG